MPPMAEKAVPDLQLDERPSLTITDEEAAALQKFSPVITGKIMKYVLGVEGYEDIADDVVEGYRDFILKVFSDEKTKVAPEVSPGVPATPVKKGWGFWK